MNLNYRQAHPLVQPFALARRKTARTKEGSAENCYQTGNYLHRHASSAATSPALSSRGRCLARVSTCIPSVGYHSSGSHLISCITTRRYPGLFFLLVEPYVAISMSSTVVSQHQLTVPGIPRSKILTYSISTTTAARWFGDSNTGPTQFNGATGLTCRRYFRSPNSCIEFWMQAPRHTVSHFTYLHVCAILRYCSIS